MLDFPPPLWETGADIWRGEAGHTGGATVARARNQAVSLKAGSGAVYPVKSKGLKQAALAWSYIAYNRQRWQRSESARIELVDRCKELLHGLGVTTQVLNALSREQIIEVSIPWNETDYSARIMPWEFVVGEALGTGSVSPFIIRHLQVGRRPAEPRRNRTQKPRALLAIGAQGCLESLPTPPAPYFFDTEIELVERLLSAQNSYDLTIEQLDAEVHRKSPDIIHLGGVDSHHGVALFPWLKPKQFDGMIFSDGEGGIKPIKFSRLAEALTQGRTKKPSVVVFNIYHSAPWSAPTAVALGARSAIGFQDTCDDLDAERYIGQFYRAWEKSDGNVLASAYAAFQSLKDYSKDRPLPSRLMGSGVVLWSDRSLVNGDVDATISAASKIGAKIREREQPRKPYENRAEAYDNLRFDIAPLVDLNYALLHNREPMFERLELRNLDEKRTVPDVKLEVELLAGPERLTFASTFDVGNAPLALRDTVFVPLTSTLSRTLSESIRVAVHTKLSVGQHEGVREQTHRVTLLPLNEWKDSDVSRQWLPSFIYPLDPAIPRIIAAAEHYLAELTDIASSGFDGYQVYGNYEEEEAVSLLDAQVEAIWSALIYKLPLRYINPPPTYTEFSQRLRSPSEVLNAGHGTCIDLTLLLAAALEYVEIYPAVFLLDGHAFPAYWRSEVAWMEFVDLTYVEGLEEDDIESLLLNRRDQPQQYSWLFPDTYYDEIKRQVEEGNLVPLESVWLTNHSKFEDAKDAGWENLSVPDEFHSLIDIKLARECNVTPLPKLEN
jgi:hypothetical protein